VLLGASGVVPLPPCPIWLTPGVELDGGKRPGGPRKEEDGRACENGSLYGYGKREVAFDVGRSEGAEDKTELRKKPIDEEGARGVEGAGSVNENVWTVEAG
jgi:hypothetical protein